ncbi:MAG TPA: PAS domain S-box protein [Ohtaekwangia sp.]|nr:PAS domain S-box protein [Ohtaekwangia sp.]
MMDEHINRICTRIALYATGTYDTAPHMADDNDAFASVHAALDALGEKLAIREKKVREDEERINTLLDILSRYGQSDFSARATLQGNDDKIDNLASGLNSLGENFFLQVRKQEDNEEQLRTIFSNAPDAVIVIDSTGKIVRWNPAAEDSLGWKATDVVGAKIHDVLIPHRYRERHIGGMSHFLKTGEGPIMNKRVQLHAMRSDGTEIDVELTVSSAKLNDEYLFIAFLRDVSARRKTEDEIRLLNATLEQRVTERTEALELSEHKYRNLFENNPMPLWVLDMPSLRFMDVNEAAIRRYGYTREEFLSMTAIDLRPEDDKMRFVALDRRHEFHHSGIWRHIKKDGAVIYAEVTVHQIMVDGRPARLVLSVDVTERIKAEAEIVRMNEELETRVARRTAELEIANKELESFSYSVSHDLRAPLRAIDGYSQMLLDDHQSQLDAEANRLLHNVKKNALRMGQLVDDLLEFSRMGRRPLKIAVTSMDSIVSQVLEQIDPDDLTNVVINVHPLGFAHGDPALLKNVFFNLITNSIKYSSTKDHPVVEIGTMNTADEQVWYVHDNGVGFDMAYYDKLFGVFHRLHLQDEFEGTGVGLAIVQRIVKRHGGRVWAEGKVDAGATFFFTLNEKFTNG